MSGDGLSRRTFLTSLSAGVVGAAALGGAAAPEAPPAADPAADGTIPVTLLVNGATHRLRVEPRTTLLEVLRDRLGLTGTKLGCGRGECGACTVLVEGEPRYACQMLAPEAEGCAVTTVEGLLVDGEPGPVQRAFVEEDAFQCGFCTSGQVMAAEGLLRRTPHPTEAQIREGLSGNLCRCGAYAHLVRAAARAAGGRGEGA